MGVKRLFAFYPNTPIAPFGSKLVKESYVDATMIEIRHDEILEPTGVTLWATRLASCLERARGHIPATDDEGKLLGSTRRHP